MKPNLFSLATKELHQDAFLTWLLQWASPKHAVLNPTLHAVAVDFVTTLINLQDDKPASITKINSGRQWENIDVWAEVNDSHLIIIEDKSGSGPHSGQLARYKKIAGQWCAEHECRLICIYLKTHSDSANNLAQVRAQGFATYARGDLLRLLESRPVKNDVYTDFVDHLRGIEDRESQYPSKQIGYWGSDDWKGFYQWLESRREGFNWFYVNNPSGGFWAGLLNYGRFQFDDAWLYMQIEEDWLCFKVGEVSERRSEIRSRYHNLLMENGGREKGLQRPARFGSGNYMTVARIPRSVWLGGDEEHVDLEAVLMRLKAHEAWFEETLKNRSNA